MSVKIVRFINYSTLYETLAYYNSLLHEIILSTRYLHICVTDTVPWMENISFFN